MQAEQQSERDRKELFILIRSFGYTTSSETWEVVDALMDRAALSHPSTPQGWKLVPIEPDSAMLDRAVAFTFNVSLSSEYRWTDYMRDLWATMLAGSPPPPEQGGKG